MTTQPTALRLADLLEQDYCSCHEGFKIRNRIDPQCESCQTKDWRNDAAAELRRLHAENLQLKKDCDGLLVIVKEWEADAATWDNIEAQRDALLEALKAMLTHMGMDEDEWNRPTFDQARAAIAKAEENK